MNEINPEDFGHVQTIDSCTDVDVSDFSSCLEANNDGDCAAEE